MCCTKMTHIDMLYQYVFIEIHVKNPQSGPPTSYKWSYNLYKWPKINGFLYFFRPNNWSYNLVTLPETNNLCT